MDSASRRPLQYKKQHRMRIIFALDVGCPLHSVAIRVWWPMENEQALAAARRIHELEEQYRLAWNEAQDRIRTLEGERDTWKERALIIADDRRALEEENAVEYAQGRAQAFKDMGSVWAGSFLIGDRVRKKSGSEWQGVVCGFYRNAHLGHHGCAVASERHLGAIQIYPDSALELVTYVIRETTE
jgi:hypothetical protein